MVFNSISFFIFIIPLFIIYYTLLKSKAQQNILLLISSYIFYGIADHKMVLLLIAATLFFYFIGIKISSSKNERKSMILTTFGVLVGIGLLFYFKYLGFFVLSVCQLFNDIGFNTSLVELNIIMPLGVSFFTFKFISYLVELKRNKINPVNNIFTFSTYISFFPTIMSGPIDRPNTFFPQLENKRSFDYNLVVDGCRQFIWGLFKKIVLADNIAVFTDYVWGNLSQSSGITLIISAFLFSFQIYTDFSGYSDMAIGIGKMFGFNITTNFKYPFFAINISEYWRRWHMSLTSWLTDYVFMPLNVKFRNINTWGIVFAIMINMIVVGMWHGANWTFILFGFYHGLLFIPLIFSGTYLKKNKSTIFTLKSFFGIVSTFILVTIGLVIFKSSSISQTVEYFSRIFINHFFELPDFEGIGKFFSAVIILMFFILF